MGNLFRAAIEHVGVRAGRGCQTMSVHVDQPGVERLLAQIKKQQAFDFTGYKRTSFERRLRRRMQEVSVADCAEYSDMLAREPNEVAALLGTVLINVTGCFRDARCWKLIADEVIDAVIQQRAPDESIRIWSAGTATGEEACSLAMLFAEALGADAYQRRVRIFATDVDEDALETARKAKYSARAVRSVPPALLEKYFERCGEAFRFHHGRHHVA